MIDKILKEKIQRKVQSVLSKNFSGEKSRIKYTNERLNFACPYCGDSFDNHYKKRGNLYWKNLMYHCYNCKYHTSLIRFLDDNGYGFSSYEDTSKILDTIKKESVPREKSIDYLQIGIFQELMELSINREDLKEKLNLSEISNNPKNMGYDYLQSRFLLDNSKYFLYSMDKNQLYFLNLTIEDRIIGYQIRNFDKTKSKYVSYTLSKMYKILDREFLSLNQRKLDTLSQFFNITTTDLTQPFVIFEGFSDSLSYPGNSISLSGVDKNSDMFDQFEDCRYFFDNDDKGIKKMESKLLKKKSVFMWKKFLGDHGLKGIKIKDFGELMVYCKTHNLNSYKTIDKYFTSDPYDILNI